MTTKYSDIHKDIIEDCKTGKSKAQYKLYQLYSKAMFNICYRMLNSWEEAEDVLQEAFTDAFIRLDSFRYESAFGAWLKRIVVNKCINHLRSKKAEFVLEDNMLSVLDEKHNNDDNDKIQEEHVKLSVEKIHRAVNQLADGYRVIFTLYMFEGYDHSEIAEILMIKESTSKSQYMRAKRKINEIILQMN